MRRLRVSPCCRNIGSHLVSYATAPVICLTTNLPHAHKTLCAAAFRRTNPESELQIHRVVP